MTKKSPTPGNRADLVKLIAKSLALLWTQSLPFFCSELELPLISSSDWEYTGRDGDEEESNSWQ